MAESAIPYRHYEPSLLEPVHPQRTRQLEDLAVSLTSKAGQLTRGLHPIVLRSLGALVRSPKNSRKRVCRSNVGCPRNSIYR
jgi:hypothetical protein